MSKQIFPQPLLALPELRISHIPRRALFSFVWSLLRGGPAELADYAPALLQALDPPVQFFGAEQVPDEGKLLILVNHFAAPGFNVLWNSLLTMHAARALRPGAPVRWVMTRQWTYLTPLAKFLLMRVTRFGFVRFAQTFGMVSMPPMPPRPGDETERALAVRRWLHLSNQMPQAVLCMSPEGRGGQGMLVEPAEGVGRVILATVRTGRVAIPAAVASEAQRLTLRFALPLDFAAVRRLPTPQQDAAATELVMHTLAGMLPEVLRGPYGRKG